MTTQLNTELKDLLDTSDRISFENMTQTTSQSLHEITPRKMHKFDQSCLKPILSPQSIAQNNRHLYSIITTILTI